MGTDTSVGSISVQDFLNWQRERDVASKQVAALEAKIATIERKIEAALVLFPKLEGAGLPHRIQPAEASEVSTWRELVYYALSQSNSGLTQRDMLEIGLSTPMAERVKQTPAGLYMAVRKLEQRSQLVRRGNYFYLPDVWEAVERGELEEASTGSEGPQDVVLSALADGKPRQPREIAQALKDNPRTSGQVQKNPNYTYPLLARMTASGKLLKHPDGTYTRSDIKIEAPNGDTVGASMTGGVAAPSIESQPALRLIG